MLEARLEAGEKSLLKPSDEEKDFKCLLLIFINVSLFLTSHADIISSSSSTKPHIVSNIHGVIF